MNGLTMLGIWVFNKFSGIINVCVLNGLKLLILPTFNQVRCVGE